MVQLDDQSTIVQKEISLISHPLLFFNNRQFIHTNHVKLSPIVFAFASLGSSAPHISQ